MLVGMVMVRVRGWVINYADEKGRVWVLVYHRSVFSDVYIDFKLVF